MFPCGSWLACDGDLEDAIAGKPAPALIFAGCQIFARRMLSGNGSPRSTLAATAAINPANS